MALIFKTCIIIFFGIGAEASNILVVIPFSARSHYVMQRPIGLELARRGHNVTVITTFGEKHHPPNYHQILIDDVKIWDLLGTERPNLFTLLETTATEIVGDVLMVGAYTFTEFVLSSRQVQHFLAQDNQYDLVITEQFYLEALNILAHKYNAPLVLISTFGNVAKHNIVTRNPLQLYSLPYELCPVENPSSFLGRLKSFSIMMYDYVLWRLWYLPKQENLIQKYIPDLPNPVPSLYEVQKNVSLMLINSHFTTDYPAAYLPNIIEIGGLHLKDEKNNSLPVDLQRILDDAEHGVVYVNFGSNIKSTEMPKDKIESLLNVFKELPQSVIMKWENDTINNKPKNVFIKKWLPQSKILAHPNIKVFISHGGLIGTQEAIYNGVPIIGMPIFADQYNNILQVEEAGVGKLFNFYDLNENNLQGILKEILNDGSYKERAVDLSNKFKDRPLHALDTAIFWIEYVIRHKGADHMKNPAIKLSWITYYMIDVALFVMIFIISAIFIVTKVVLVFFRFLQGTKVIGIKRKLKVP